MVRLRTAVSSISSRCKGKCYGVVQRFDGRLPLRKWYNWCIVPGESTTGQASLNSCTEKTLSIHQGINGDPLLKNT